jgi:CPA2 family monovalent cation:H+ antiporter-2
LNDVSTITEPDNSRTQLVIIGFGPAGQNVAHALLNNYRDQIVVIDLNSRNTAIAQRIGLAAQLGDASRREVLEHAQIHFASVIVITIPDPNASRTIIHHCKYLAPNAVIVARARYHVLRWELQLAGALDVVDEEENVGLRLASEAHKHMSRGKA